MRRVLVVTLALGACRAGRHEVAERPRFEDYPVTARFSGPTARLDLSSDSGAHEFRTVLREGANAAPNFAGHYIVVSWGCGSPCHAFGLIDVATGRIYMAPFSVMSGAEYRLESALFVAEPLIDSVLVDSSAVK